MIDHQHPLGSGFDARTTASAVLAGRDLTGKFAIVTGGHSGLGLETTRALASAGADVLVGARDPAPPGWRPADCPGSQSPPSTCRISPASGALLTMFWRPAGISTCSSPMQASWPARRHGSGRAGRRNSPPTISATSPSPTASGRCSRRRPVIAVSSAGHHVAPIRWDDPHFSGGYDKWRGYGQSKTANALFAVHLDRLGRDRGIRAFSLHPGKIFTPLQRHLTQAEMAAEGWLDAAGAPADPTFKNPAQGAATQVWAATSPLLDGLGGLYCEDCDVAMRAELAGAPFVGVKAYAVDRDEAERLWAFSADLTELDFWGR